MNLKHLFFETDGRIGRKQFWIGTLIMVVAVIIIAILGSSLVFGGGAPSGVFSLIVFLVFAYPAYCLYIKRLHDRENSGLPLIIYLALTFIATLLSLGIPTPDLTNPEALVAFTNSPIFWVLQILNIVIAGFAIYLLVICGFLKGTSGPNIYGPDPLA